MPILLETERLVLRSFTQDDWEYLFELDNDPEVMRFVNGGTPTPQDVIRDKILPVFLSYDPDFSGFGFWAAIERRTGNFLGWVCLRAVSGAPGEAGLGYRLHKAAWGQGYATEGAGALVQRGFTELGLQRIVATTYEYNLASRRVMEKLGLRLVRTFRLEQLNQQTAHFVSTELWDGDDVEYVLEKADWEASLL